MIFDAEISVFSASVATPSPEALEEGAPAHVECGIVTGAALPVMNPQTGEPLLVPFGRLRFGFAREQAIEFFQKGLEAAQSLPDEPGKGKVVVAHSMSDVENAAKALKTIQR